jgi:hypothetical protein
MPSSAGYGDQGSPTDGSSSTVQLHTQSVHKILKDVYWLLKKLPNIREANLTSSDQRVTVGPDIGPQGKTPLMGRGLRHARSFVVVRWWATCTASLLTCCTSW